MKCGETIFSLHLFVLQREGGDDFFALVLQPALIEAEGNELVQFGATR